VILRKLLDREVISQQFYARKIQQWIKEFEESTKSKGGGNYYATQATYLCDRFLNLAFGKYYQGHCTLEQLADYLNVRVRSVAGLEQIVLRKTP
jgi:Zn-dependent peptidase ImmA (M78 family)